MMDMMLAAQGDFDGSSSLGSAARDVAAGKSVGGEDDPAEPPIYQRRAAGSLVAVRLNCTVSQPASERITLR
jgi:hypothetical protein